MNKSQITKRIIFSAMLKLLVLVGLLTAGFIFLVSQLKAQTSSLENKQTQLVIFQTRENSKANLEKGYKEVEPNLPKLSGALPKKDDLTQFVEALEKTAPGLTLRFEEKNPAPNIVLLEVKLSGDMNYFMNFIKKLEELPYFVKLNSFEITSNTATLKVSLEVSQ